MADESKILARIERGETQELRISVSEYKGKSYLDARIFFTKDKENWFPTQKGITVYPEDLDTFAEAIEEAKKELMAID